MLICELIATCPKTDIADPILKNDLTLNVEARLKDSCRENSSPNRIFPLTLSADPVLMKPLIDIVEPTLRKSNVDNTAFSPNLLKPTTLIPEPMQPIALTDKDDPI
jgi:hypothetical protein